MRSARRASSRESRSSSRRSTSSRRRSSSTRSSCVVANHVERDQASGLPYSSKRLLGCYDRAAELAGWEARDALRELAGDGLLRGMGCATQIWWGGGGPPAHAIDPARRRRPRARDDGHPGHRHRHPHVGEDRRGGGARAPARPCRRARRRHRPQRVRARLRRLDDDTRGDARRPQRRRQGASHRSCSLAADVLEISADDLTVRRTAGSGRATARSTSTSSR